ncbi:MAG TPA: hypothetical protein VGJ12_07920, partial [Gemmatimonadaceae bacterium]
MIRVGSMSVRLALVLCIAAPALAQHTDSTPVASRGVFTRGDAITGTGIVIATAAIHPFDERIAVSLQRPALQSRTGLRHTATAFRLLGSPGVLILGGALYV